MNGIEKNILHKLEKELNPTLIEIKDFLINQSSIPNHTPKGDNFTGCDLGRYANEITEALKL